MNVTATRIYLLCTPVPLLAITCIARAADQPASRAVLQPANEPKAAPDFALKDTSGKTIRLKQYHGKVVLLDFWATWCTGCKKEIPWFSAFEETYHAKGLVVVGVAMDDEGWKVVKPFLAENHVPYRMLLGNDATAKGYGTENLPDTFLIDRQGRVAASYRAVLVDKDDIEVKIKALLSKR